MVSHDAGSVKVVEDGALGRESAADVGCSGVRVAVAGEVAEAHVVGEEHDDVGLLGVSGGRKEGKK